MTVTEDIESCAESTAVSVTITVSALALATAISEDGVAQHKALQKGSTLPRVSMAQLQRARKEDDMRQIVEVYEELQALESYRLLNFQALRKIVKKLDKLSGVSWSCVREIKLVLCKGDVSTDT
eukprot:Opistho-2@38898